MIICTNLLFLSRRETGIFLKFLKFFHFPQKTTLILGQRGLSFSVECEFLNESKAEQLPFFSKRLIVFSLTAA